MTPASGPATSLHPGRRLLILALLIASAALPPLSLGQDLPGSALEQTAPRPGDSLALRLLELDIEEARREADEAALWRRLIPSVRLSASLGISEFYFQDEPGALVLPRDAYRITISLSLSDIFETGPCQKALARVQRLQTEREILRRRLEAEALAHERRQGELRRNLEAAEAELLGHERIARFYRMRFEQGAVEYPVAARAELELLALRLRLRSLKARLTEEEPARPVTHTPDQREESP